MRCVDPRWVPAGREIRHTATELLDGRILLVGGWVSAGTALASAEIYDPRDGSFTLTGSLVSARYQHSATRLPDGRVLVVGGRDIKTEPDVETIPDLETILPTSAELYDPATGGWTPTGAIAHGRYGHSATRSGDHVIIVGGEPLTEDNEIFDPATMHWGLAGRAACPRTEHVAIAFGDGRILVTAGYRGVAPDCIAQSELYDPQTGAWSAAAPIPIPVDDAAMAADGPEHALVLGGFHNGVGIRRDVQRYDLGSDTWVSAGAMTHALMGAKATLLDDGRVLVVGGIGDPWLSSYPHVDLSAEDGGFRSTVPMQEPRGGGHTATTLCDGSVLVVGGPRAERFVMAAPVMQ